MRTFLAESGAKKCAEILNALQNGSSLEQEAEKLRGENMTPYTKAQVMYALILFLLQDGDAPTKLAFDFILDWREEIIRDGLSANADIPDDRKMRLALSRSSQTASRLWEAQGHEHWTEGLSLLERIYTVHRQLAADTPQT